MTVSIDLPSTMNPIGGGVAASEALTSPSPLLAPYIDPVTHDFLSLVSGMDPIDAQVINALKIIRRSGPAVMDVGARFVDVKKILTSTVQDLKAQVQTALSGLIKRGDIRYLGTIVDINEPGQQMIQIRPQWVNLRAFNSSTRDTTIVVSPGDL